MDLGLAGKKALVTAASAGLGFAAARELVAEGANVFICGRDTQRLAAALERLRMKGSGGRIDGATADVAVQEQAVALVNRAAESLGGLDILITNAGGPPGGTFATTDLDAWRRGVDLTLMSPVVLIKTALPYLEESHAASILTVTSISVKQPISGLLLSNVIRPAVVGLTKSLSQELGPRGIRTNSVLPGWTMTERVEYIMDHRAANHNTSAEEETEKITSGIPLGRMALPEEFGRVAAFLVSPAASYINGVMLLVDGGSYGGLL